MARCEVCGRKIPPTKRFCGGDTCKATATQIIPRCQACGQLLSEGNANIVCPINKGPHTLIDNDAVVSIGNASVTIPTVANYHKVVK